MITGREKQIVYVIFGLMSLITEHILTTQKAIVIVPVADLVTEPMASNPFQSYETLTLSGGIINPYKSCPRAHQLIFNETVEIVGQYGNEVSIKIPNLFYITESNPSPHRLYWTNKKSFITFDELKKKQIPVDHFPPPITFLQSGSSDDKQIVTLSEPFWDSVTHQTYSAGTRFVLVPGHHHEKHEFSVFIFNTKTQSFNTALIPKKLCHAKKAETHKEMVRNFLHVLHTWAHPKSGFIPYVWGGCSYTRACHDTEFSYHTPVWGSYYEYASYNHNPKEGFDCSNLIARAAQIVGMPFYFKNTYTMVKLMESLKSGEMLSDGDIIWVPGHVMVVSHVKKNMVIEASSYLHGNGKVQEIGIDRALNVANFKELIEKHAKGKLIQRRNCRTNKIEPTHVPVKILRMSSIWK